MDEYLRHMFAYIHLNPVKMIEPKWKKDGLVNLPAVDNFLQNYKFSSYLDYLEQPRLQNKILNREAFPNYFAGAKEIKIEMMEWLDFDNFD